MKAMHWKNWIGGGVIATALLVGCFSSSLVREAGSEKAWLDRAPASKPQATKPSLDDRDQPHNGGKIRIPVEASFEGDSTISISTETERVVQVIALEDIASASIRIVGRDGLGKLSMPEQKYDTLIAGDPQRFTFLLPPLSGSLVVMVSGVVGGTPMSGTIELKVINPKEAKVQTSGSTVDSLGTVIEAVPAGKVETR